VGEVRQRVRKEGWNTCVVVNDQLVVLGLLSANDLEKADPQWTAEEAMQRDPQTYRLNASTGEVAAFFRQQAHIDSVLITTPDGKLFGLIRRADLEQAASPDPQSKI
jgi:predicted transcriptional regulator